MPVVERIDTYRQEPPEGHEYREGFEWVACYCDEEPDEFNGEAFGYGPTEERARTDLMLRFPRKD